MSLEANPILVKQMGVAGKLGRSPAVLQVTIKKLAHCAEVPAGSSFYALAAGAGKTECQDADTDPDKPADSNAVWNNPAKADAAGACNWDCKLVIITNRAIVFKPKSAGWYSADKRKIATECETDGSTGNPERLAKSYQELMPLGLEQLLWYLLLIVVGVVMMGTP